MIKLLTILSAGVLLTGCMQQPATSNQTGTPTSAVVPTESEDLMLPDELSDDTSTSGAAMAGAVKEFTVEGSNFAFTPASIKVKTGDTVRVTFKNANGIHDFVIDEFNAKTKQIPGGQSETVEFVADKAGTYEYYCSVGQHRKNGMVGQLIVE